MEIRFADAVRELTGHPWSKQRPHWLINDTTGRLLELDMVCDSLSIAVEYNGAQHYTYPNKFHTNREEFEMQVDRDRKKRDLCTANGIRLVEIKARSSLQLELDDFLSQCKKFGVVFSQRAVGVAVAPGTSQIGDLADFARVLNAHGIKPGPLGILCPAEILQLTQLVERIVAVLELPEDTIVTNAGVSSPWLYLLMECTGEGSPKALAFDMGSFRMRLDGDGVGYLHGRDGLPVPQDAASALGCCAVAANCTLSPHLSWQLVRPDQAAATFKTVADTPLELQLANPDAPSTSGFVRVLSMGRGPVLVKVKKHVNVVGDAMNKTIEHARHVFNISSLFNVGDERRVADIGRCYRGRDCVDEGVVGAKWLEFLAAADPAVRGEHRIAYDMPNKRYYFFHLELRTWVCATDADVVASRIKEAMHATGFFDGVLADPERKFLSTVRSRRDLLCHCKKAFTDGAAELVDALDQRHDLLPMRNGVVELDTGVFRRGRWDDYVRETTGYDYVPEADMPPDHVEWVERFYEMLFPMPDERELFLRIAAYALSGAMTGKWFAVLTDKRNGNAGKSCATKLMLASFGNLGMPTQGGYLYASPMGESANGHASNDLSYIGKRLAVFDETDPDRKLDMGKVKRLTGGCPQLALRAANSATVSRVRWTAFLLIACNEGCLPKINVIDDALIKRMIVINMRSVFVPAEDLAAIAAREEHVFPADPAIEAKIERYAAANLLVLLRALARFRAADNSFGPIPESCQAIKREIASSSDPKMEMLSDFIEARVSFAPAAPAYIKRDDLIERFKSSIRQTDMATFRAAFNGVSAADFKRLADKAMDPFGRKFLEDSARAGVGRVRRGYAECEFKEDASEDAE